MSTQRVPNELAARLRDGELYAGDPFPTDAALRAEAPVAWCEPGGFWALTGHAGVLAASTDPDTFCSRRGILAMEIGVEYDTPPTMTHTDPPEHTAYRNLVAPGFRPSVIKRAAEQVAARTAEVLDRLPAGTFDAVGGAGRAPAVAADRRRAGRARGRPRPVLRAPRSPRCCGPCSCTSVPAVAGR